jgi:Fic family protein
MIISVEQMQLMKKAPNSAYELIMPEFLFHSNKLEGSTFSEDELALLVEQGIVEGSHEIDDVLETKNSIDVFNYVIDTLGCELDDAFLFELNRLLFKNTTDEKNGFTGHYKEIPNRIRSSSVQVALPSDLPQAMHELFEQWDASLKDFDAIAEFHIRFEHVHPFQNGNGRIGRFLMLKQCLENEIDIIVVDESFDRPYKSWLEVAQTEGDSRFFKETLIDSQNLFTQKMHDRGIDRLIPTK